MTEKTRAWLYRILTPLGALLVFYGVLGEEELALWLGLFGTVLMAGEGALAIANTSTREHIDLRARIEGDSDE